MKIENKAKLTQKGKEIIMNKNEIWEKIVNISVSEINEKINETKVNNQ